jgi:hypothetical protein
LRWFLHAHPSFKRRSFEFPSCRVKEDEGDEDYVARLAADAQRCRSILLSDTQCLLSRVDICRKLRSLSISLNWRNRSFSAANIGFDDADFFDPLKAGFVHVLRACSQLTELSLAAFRCSVDLAEALASLRGLRRVTLLTVVATTELWEAAMADTLPHNPSVVDLSLAYGLEDSWAFLSLFPNLVTLGMRSTDGVRLLQLTDVHDRLRVFERLPRLCVSSFWYS